MSVSDRVKRGMEIGSWIRRMFEEGIAMKKRYGADNVYDLSLGNPLMEPPREFKSEIKRLADDPFPGMHRYMENAGYPETRAAVAAQLTKETGLKLTEKDIIMAVGAGGAVLVSVSGSWVSTGMAAAAFVSPAGWRTAASSFMVSGFFDSAIEALAHVGRTGAWGAAAFCVSVRFWPDSGIRAPLDSAFRVFTFFEAVFPGSPLQSQVHTRPTIPFW